jgi:hypothetical protein
MSTAERAKQMREFAEALFRHFEMCQKAGLVRKQDFVTQGRHHELPARDAIQHGAGPSR